MYDGGLVADGFVREVAFLRLEAADAVIVTGRHDPARYRPALFDAMGVPAPPGLLRMALKRQADHLAGRIGAALAMDRLGLVPAAVGIGPGGAPCWPEGMSGSISHGRNRFACLLDRRRGRLAGVDVEAVATPEAAAAIRAKCLSPRERNLAPSGNGLPEAVAATLLFSAKETIFKALYPVVGHHFGFDAAEAIARPAPDCVAFRLTGPLHPALPAGTVLAIHFRLAADHLLTWLSAPFPFAAGVEEAGARALG